MKVQGKLFDEGHRARAIRDALAVSAFKGLARVRSDTPVDTGRLKDGFEATGVFSSQSVQITNPVPYFRWVENGTRRMRPRRMLAKNIPWIVKETKKNIARSLSGKL
jgi:hypothetical protein